MIDNNHPFKVTYQDEEMCYINQIIDNALVDTLHNIVVDFEEIKIYVDLIGQIVNNKEKDDKENAEKEEEEDEDEEEEDDVEENDNYTK